jgi:hypothetical protein
MADNDEAAREAKARQLHEQIEELTAPAAEPKKSEAIPGPARPKSFRELIHERMRELDKEKEAKD